MIAVALYLLGAWSFWMFMTDEGKSKGEASITAVLWPIVVIGAATAMAIDSVIDFMER